MKMKMETLLAIILGIILITTNISSASSLASLYTEGDIQGKIGQNVNVKIMASGMDNVGTIAIGLVFDNSVLSVSSVSDGNVKTPDAFSTSNVNNAQGVIAMGLGNPSGINGDGTLFIINFKVIGHVSDTSSLKLSITASDTAGNVIDTSNTKITHGKFSVVGEGGEGGGLGGIIEPYENVLKYEIKERSVSSAPITFTYTVPELSIYEVVLTTAQSGIALLRIDVLKGTSKLVETDAPGLVYKNNNLWIDYKRVKSAFIRYKVENSWIDENKLSADNVKMYRWDKNNKKWIELLTNVINKDDNNTYFESQTDTIPASFAITGRISDAGNIGKVGTENTTAKPVMTPNVTPAINESMSKSKLETGFDMGMLVYASSFKSENGDLYAEILDKLVSHNITRVIVPIYDARKGDNIHIFHAETKGLGVGTTNSYSIDKLLTEAHNRNINVYLRISIFGPDAVEPSEDQKQNVKKIINHLLTNYSDDKGGRLDGIFLDHIYFEEPMSAKGNTDIMANFVKDLKDEVNGRAILSTSVKPAYYESLLHIYVWPYIWPLSGPSDYYKVMRDEGQDYAKLSKNLDFMSPISYNDDHNYAGKVTKFIKDKAGANTNVIPNVQSLGETKDPSLRYAIESAKNNGAKGVNIVDYSSMSNEEWQVLDNVQ